MATALRETWICTLNVMKELNLGDLRSLNYWEISLKNN